MDSNIKSAIENGLGDCSLLGIQWSLNGEDLIFTFAPLQKTIIFPVELKQVQLEFRFIWVTGLEIDMQFGQYMGTPLLFEARLDEYTDSGTKVEFEFGVAPQGRIQFTCDRVEAIEL